jgi:hypothetical protein
MNISFAIRETSFFVDSSSSVSVLPVWRDKTDQTNNASISKQFGDFTNSSNVFFSIFGAETEIFVEAESDVITVQDIGGNVLFAKVFFDSHGDGRFSRAGKTGEPDGASFEGTSVDGGSGFSVDFADVGGDVLGFWFRHFITYLLCKDIFYVYFIKETKY